MAYSPMRPNAVPFSVLAAALGACVVEPELLNSERIEARFGNYGIDVIAYGETLRRSNLYSQQNGLRTCRTYALVRFEDVAEVAIADEHADILDGQSIGETFRSTGWDIFKETLYVDELRLEVGHPIAELMRLEGNADAAMHVYRLLLEKSGTVIDYATIVEVHHPDYLDAQELAELFEPVPPRGNRPGIENWKTLVLETG